MRVLSLVEKINKIENISVTEANFGVGEENRLKIEIKNEADYIKWDYFCEKLHKAVPNVKISKKFPVLTFVFPLYENILEDAVYAFYEVLGRKYYLIQKPMIETMSIILKVTNLCNIDCQYCYDKPFREKLGHNGILKLDRLERIIEMASRYAEKVIVLYHGGEPTLAGMDYYREVAENILPKFPYCDFDVCMQTNGTLLDDEWIEFAKEYNIGIGSSYNATAEDLRPSSTENALHKDEHNIFATLENIKRAKREHDYTIGVIDVLTKENQHKVIDIYEFYKDAGVNACFNEVHSAGDEENEKFLFTTKQDMDDFIKCTEEYFRYWATDKDERHFVDRHAAQYIQMILDKNSSTCNFGTTCVNYWLGVNSNGDIYPCDRALPDKYRIGNVYEFDSIDEIFDSPKYRNYRGEVESMQETYCRKCEIYEYCRGGCPMKAIDANGHAGKPNHYSCKMSKETLLCAYKSLIGLTIEDCNTSLQQFLIRGCHLLPSEIPLFLEEIGLSEEFKHLDFSKENAHFGSDEIKMLNMLNSIELKGYEYKKEYIEEMFTCHDKLTEDNRFEKLKKALKSRAEYLTEKFNNI